MREQNKKTVRLKRAKLQQLVISLSCLFLLVFVFGWMINLAVNTNKIDVDDSSSRAVGANVKSNESKDDDDSSLIKNPDSESNADSVESTPEIDSSNDIKDDDFADAAFIGDSRTVGLQMNTDKPKASFYASIGLNIDSALTDSAITLDNGEKGKVLDAMKQRQFGRIYIMFGINELGWPYPDIFEEKYEELINQIRKVQPDAKIYVQSILPVSYLAANTNAVFTNENINNFNKYVKQAAENTDAVYLDVGSYFKDENGSLPVEASTDGIHFIREYCQEWMNYLADNS
jgi:lysophospholipase L1-like esterase